MKTRLMSLSLCLMLAGSCAMANTGSSKVPTKLSTDIRFNDSEVPHFVVVERNKKKRVVIDRTALKTNVDSKKF